MIRRLLVMTALTLVACKGGGPRSPEALQRAYLDAVERDDAKAAYALLAPEVQANVDPEEFERRWARDAAERKRLLAAASSKDVVARREAVTTHEGGRTVTWTRAGDHYLAMGGLPGLPRTDTPAAAIRALLGALRHGDLAGLAGIAAPELLEFLREGWDSRADAIEDALKRPDALSISDDGQRAELRYGTTESLRLEQSAGGWRVTSLE